jgi:hypothetical protein
MQTFRDFLTENVDPKTTQLVHNALALVSRHTNTDAYKPYFKHVKVTNAHGQPNLVNITFPVEGMPAGQIVKNGPFDREHRSNIAQATAIAKELEDELKGTMNIEDSSIEEKPRGVTLFMVSDDFVDQ